MYMMSFRHHSDVYMLAKGTISVAKTAATDTEKSIINKLCSTY